MQNIPLEFDLLVLGNEPGGLWLLREFSKLYSHEASIKQTNKIQANLGWLRLSEPPSSLYLPKTTAHHFNIETKNVFSAEIASTQNLFRWSPEKVFTHFSSLPKVFKTRFMQSLSPPNSKERQAIRVALNQQPELLTYAQALWKKIGRSRKMTPELMVWAALQATELSQYDSEGLVSELNHLKTFDLSEYQKWISIEKIPSPNIQSKGKVFKITLSSGVTLFTKFLVLNLSLRQLRTLNANSNLISWAPDIEPILSRFCHYPITLEFENYRLPQNIQPLTLLLDEEILPEPDIEMWPMTVTSYQDTQSVTLWATDRAEFSYEGVSQNIKKALGRFHYHFPQALKKITGQSISLGLDSCYCDEQRAITIQQIERDRQELYGVSLLHVRTRKKGIYSLLPALHCTLPYPLGPLTGAREILKDLFSRKTLQNYSPEKGIGSLTSP